MKDDLTATVRRVAREFGLILGLFAAASLLGAVIWNAIVDPPRWQSAGQGQVGLSMLEATKTVGIDAGFIFVAAPLGLLLGAALTYWRRRTPVTVVVLIALASVLAAALMERFGLWVGPADPADLLRVAKAGVSAPVQLRLQATGALLVWPATALLGSMLVLLFAPASRFEAEVPEREIVAESLVAPH